MQANHHTTESAPLGWRWLEKMTFGWHQPDEPERAQKHIVWLEKGIEIFDREKKLYIIRYDSEKYDGEDFFHDKVELWVRPEPHLPVYRVLSENILAFDEKQGFLFVNLKITTSDYFES